MHWDELPSFTTEKKYRYTYPPKILARQVECRALARKLLKKVLSNFSPPPPPPPPPSPPYLVKKDPKPCSPRTTHGKTSSAQCSSYCSSRAHNARRRVNPRAIVPLARARGRSRYPPTIAIAGRSYRGAERKKEGR